MAAPSTKLKLLSLIEDMEIVTRELLEHFSTPKQQRPEGIDTSQLIELLVHKDKEIQETVQIAKLQTESQKTLDELKAEVQKRNQDIRQLQKNLKEAESILATAIFQAKQKLQSIQQSQKRKISSEELIKYAHKISASNAVASPSTWTPGDSRRPYPTYMDMRLSLLTDLPMTGQHLQSQTSLSDALASGRNQTQMEHSMAAPTSHTQSSGSSLSWQHSMEMQGASGGVSHQSAASMDSKGHNKENEDVELMSTDSSSSSSSDE